MAFPLLSTCALLVGAACETGGGSAAPTSDAGSDTGAETSGMDATVDSGVVIDALPDYVVPPYDGSTTTVVARVPVHAEIVSRQVEVAPLMFAAGEMQTSGEPFAELFAGRNLNDYDRSYLPTDQYILNNGSATEEPMPITDLFGFSTAVESYEYSKYHVNMVVQESTAGISLANGPLVGRLEGASSLDRLTTRMKNLLQSAGTELGGYAIEPPPPDNPLNYTGFPGEWVSFAPFADFDPTMQPTLMVVKSCTNSSSGYGGLPTLGASTPVYECSYNTTHLPDPIHQVDRVLSPRVLGMTAWKEALWSIDFAGRLHDAASNPVNAVAAADLSSVGTLGNAVVGTSPPPPLVVAGTYIGSSPLEGMWGLTMLAALDNGAEYLVSSLTTSDGVTLAGFPTKLQALQYDYTSPLTWFPTAINVTEDDTVIPYPAVAQLGIADATSYGEDLSALLLGNALFFGMTDARNVGLGQKQGLLATFDGDPFAADDGLPDGEETAHDRALAILRVAFVDLDRMHADPALGVLHDSATVAGGVVTQGSTVTTSSLAHALLGLAQTLLSLNAAITQYGAPDTNPLGDAQGELNALPIHPPGVTPVPSFSARVRAVLTTNAIFVRDVLTQTDGSVANGASITGGVVTVDASPTTLQTQAAAARALTEAFLITSDPTFLARAQAVVRKLNTDFYSAPARMYRGLLGGPDDVMMNPELFGWLQSSLRETYEVLYVPGDPELDRNVLQDRIARVNKLFLNGWDDLNGDQHVDYPGECLAGRMQMAEQLLTGELGHDTAGQPTADRDQDCVPELAHAQVASALASTVHFSAAAAGDAGPADAPDAADAADTSPIGWSIVPSGSAQNLSGLWGSGPSDVWVAGLSATIQHWDGTSWSASSFYGQTGLLSMWGSGATDVWSVGVVGATAHWDGMSWTAGTAGTGSTLYGVWGSAASDVWAVGGAGSIVHFDGASWSPVPSTSPRSLAAVWGSGPDDVWASGSAGTLLHWNGLAWSLSPSGTTANLHAVWGSGPTDVWAAGDGGALLHWNGAAWSPVNSGVIADLYGLWGSSTGNAFAVGSSGTIVHWNGAGWSVSGSGTSGLLATVWGSGPGSVWSAGASGLVLSSP